MSESVAAESGLGLGSKWTLESIICSRVNNTLMNHTPGNFSEDLKSHCIPNIGGYTNPPACFLLGRWEGLIRVEVENTFIESVLEEG